MKLCLPIAVGIAFCAPLWAEDKPVAKKGIEGYWLGTLKVGAIELRLGVKLESKDGKLSATIHNIDQGGTEIPVDSAVFADNTLSLKLAKDKKGYVGKLQADGDTIKGELEEGMTLDLKRQEKEFTLNRPQTPKKPYPYVEEEVTFASKAKDVMLAGTFTKPKGDGPFLTAVLISGSGPQDRDEALLGHRPFLVLADHLTRKGIAVLRYDDRGIGKSTGDFVKATSKDFADDTAGAIVYLKGRKEVGKIGLVGHSEGGMIAPLVAVENTDVAFIVLLAGPGTPCDELMVAQGQLIIKAMGGDEKALKRQRKIQTRLFALAKSGASDKELKEAMSEIGNDLTEAERKDLEKSRAALDAQIALLISPWFRYFICYDPAPTLKKVKCPVLAINGEKDLQVPPKENLAAIEAALKSGGNSDVTVKEFPGLNHLFQTCKTGVPGEYGKIEETFAPAALEAISEWLLKQR